LLSVTLKENDYRLLVIDYKLVRCKKLQLELQEMGKSTISTNVIDEVNADERRGRMVMKKY